MYGEHNSDYKSHFDKRMVPYCAQMILANAFAPRVFHPGTCQNEAVHAFVNSTGLGKGRRGFVSSLVRLWTIMLYHNMKRIHLIRDSKPQLWQRMPKDIKEGLLEEMKEVEQLGQIHQKMRDQGWYHIDPKTALSEIGKIVKARIEQCQLIVTDKPVWNLKQTETLLQFLEKEKQANREPTISQINRELFGNIFGEWVIMSVCSEYGYLVRLY